MDITLELIEPTDQALVLVEEPIQQTEVSVVVGQQGPAGPPNSLTIGTVTTGASGDPADAQITGTSPSQTLSLTLPRGDQGIPGDPGFIVSDTAPSTAGVWIDPTVPTDAIITESVLPLAINTAIVAGTNITTSYDSGTGKTTISSTGGGGSTSPATTTTQGTVKLAGDLAGTADLPTVPALALKAPIDSPSFTGVVSGITKSMVGLSNVDNTSDTNKPISSATQTALNAKAPLASPTFTGTVSGITKTMVGLGNVDNTSDVAKPISTATQTALSARPLKSESFGVRNRIDASTWEARPVGFKSVITVGADPSPVDMQDGDIRIVI